MPKVGIIAGSGFNEFEGVSVRDVRKVSTPYGEPSDSYRICEFKENEFVFLARHGSPHRLQPHRINYRANIWGLRDLGVERILSINAVGGINTGLRPGDIVITDQIIDVTSNRANTFYDSDKVIHIDFTEPYCNELRNALFTAGSRKDVALVNGGTYISVNGPRLETAAEIALFARNGGDVVGMTGMPEACLARELEICFSCIAVVTNSAAGLSSGRLTATEVVDTMKVSTERIRNLLMAALSVIPAERNCECRHALKDAIL